MLTKTDADEIQDYLSDASYLRGGNADCVLFPETAQEVGNLLLEATRTKTPVTVSGAGTGTVAGRVPFGGIVIATDKLNRIKSVIANKTGGRAIAQSGVRLMDLQRTVDAQGLLYPPDPTERSCFLGGNIATNASGARTFKYGPTRNYVSALKIALANGDIISICRGERFASEREIRIPVDDGRI